MANGKEYRNTATDISEDGVFVAFPPGEPLQTGDEVQIQSDLVELCGQVVRKDKKGAGIKFTDLDSRKGRILEEVVKKVKHRLSRKGKEGTSIWY